MRDGDREGGPPPENRGRGALSDDDVGETGHDEVPAGGAEASDRQVDRAADPDADAAVPGAAADGRGRPPLGGRRPARARRPGRPGLVHAGIGLWGTPLVVLALCLLCWTIPFASPPADGSGEWLDVPTVAHPYPAASVAPLVTIDALGVTLDGRRVASATDVRTRGEDALDALARDLEIVRRNAALVHPGVAYPGRISLRVARGTPWVHIRPVLLRAARAGHARVAFLVRAPSSESPAFDWARFSPR